MARYRCDKVKDRQLCKYMTAVCAAQGVAKQHSLSPSLSKHAQSLWWADLDAVPVVSNRDDGPCFLQLAKVYTIEMIRRIHLVMALQPTQHYLEVNFP